MISSVRFSAFPQPVAQRKSPKFVLQTKPALSTLRFGENQDGNKGEDKAATRKRLIVASGMILAAMMTLETLVALKKVQNTAQETQAVKKASVLSELQTKYQALSSAEDKLNFLTKTLAENHFKNLPQWGSRTPDLRDEIAQWTIEEAAKLPEDKQKIKFMLSAMDNEPNPLQGGMNQSIALGGIQDITLKHQLKMVFDAHYESQADYDKQWQALAKALEDSDQK